MSDRDYYKPHKRVRIFKVDYAGRERGIRLYSTQYGESWSLQVRGPLGVGNQGLRDGKDFVVADASLSVEDMKELRAEITAFLQEIGELGEAA
jgi:hypothetical protein